MLKRLFMNASHTAKHNLSSQSTFQQARWHSVTSASTPNSSNLVRQCIKDDTASLQSYQNYLDSYHEALNYCQQGKYAEAKQKGEQAYAYLTEVNAITAVLGKDFFRIDKLFNELDENESTSSSNYLKNHS